ncbi:hypothetical protein CLOM_g3297 [Closterium sp. NIES-68]|nr:hypothetical protein CLOM_g17102 [Closterium sp. NIES-68]GJP43901.1 hypothetical protein CLOM_g3297 [Closterium sp. NIES-68]GJP73093.1 hypothetical protein CLOP_g3840 [Closterium sp. NIES-67]
MAFPAFPSFITPWAHSLLYPDTTTTADVTPKRKADNEPSAFLDSALTPSVTAHSEKRARISESSSSLTSFHPSLSVTSFHPSLSVTSAPFLSILDGKSESPLWSPTASPPASSPLSSPPVSPLSLPASSSALVSSPPSAAYPALPRRLKGVRQRKWGRWVTEIRCPRTKTRVWLGSYASAEEAVRVYDMAARMIFGEVASKLNLNAPDAIPRPVTIAKSIAEALIKVARANTGTSGGDASSDNATVDLSAFRGEMACLEVVGQNVVVSECAFAPLALTVTTSSGLTPMNQSVSTDLVERSFETSQLATSQTGTAGAINGVVTTDSSSASDMAPSALSLIEELFNESFCESLATPAAAPPSVCDLGDFESLENVASLWEDML